MAVRLAPPTCSSSTASRPKHSWGQNFLDDRARARATSPSAARLGPRARWWSSWGRAWATSRACCSTPGPGWWRWSATGTWSRVLEELKAERLTVRRRQRGPAGPRRGGRGPAADPGGEPAVPPHLVHPLPGAGAARRSRARCVFTVQKEVAERVAAGEGARERGLLTVLLGRLVRRVDRPHGARGGLPSAAEGGLGGAPARAPGRAAGRGGRRGASSGRW